MTAIPPSTSLQLVDHLIKTIENMSVSPISQSSKIDPNGDICWSPVVAIGHTPYSWEGTDPIDPFNSKAHKLATFTSNSLPGSMSPKQLDQTRNATKQQLRAEMINKSNPKKQSNSKLEIDPNQPPFTRLDIRVGKILSAEKHPDAEKLYVEKIDVGETEPRQIVSGLVQFIPQSEMVNRMCLVICNLKPSALRGITSYGMVLCASNADHTKIEFIEPPSNAKIGERVGQTEWQPDKEINPKKSGNVWETLKPKLLTNENCVACFDGQPILTSAGECKSATLNNVTIS